MINQDCELQGVCRAGNVFKLHYFHCSNHQQLINESEDCEEGVDDDVILTKVLMLQSFNVVLIGLTMTGLMIISKKSEIYFQRRLIHAFPSSVHLALKTVGGMKFCYYCGTEFI